MTADSDWELLPAMVLRSAGFPWQMVERLSYPDSARLLDDLLGLEDAATGLAAAVRPASRLSRGQRSKLRNLRPMTPEDPVPEAWLLEWNELTTRLGAVRSRLADAVGTDAKLVGEVIAEIRDDVRVNDAIVCSSPAVYRDLSRGERGKRIQRQIASYAQRLASKSETMSFFGPINYATLSRDVPTPSVFRWQGHEPILVRQAHTAARVNDAMQRLIITDDALATHLVPRRKTVFGAPRGADPVSVLIREADGERNITEIASLVGVHRTELLEAFRTAVAKGLLTHDLAPPATVVDPLRWTLERLDRSARTARVRTLLKSLLELLDSYPGAAAGEKLEIQAAIDSLMPVELESASRSRFYNDRVVVHEAAAGTAELLVSGTLAVDMCDAVAPVLDLLAEEAEHTRQLTNQAIAAKLGHGRFPLLTAVRECADLEIRVGFLLRDELAGVLADVGPEIAAVDLAGRVEPRGGPVAPVLCSIDVLVATSDLAGYETGRTPIVLGDIHDAALLTPWALQFNPDRERLLAERDDAVRRALGDQRVLNVISRRTTGLPPLEFPGTVLELGGCAAPGRQRIGIDQLFLQSDGKRAHLRSDIYPGESLLFHNGELDTALHTALALPRIRRPRLPDLAHVPRLTWGNVTLSRRRWTVPSDQILDANVKGNEGDRLLDVARFRHRLGVPRRVFAKSPNERKPIFVDMASPNLLSGLTRLASTAEQLVLSEVLPAPEQTWLRDGELRFASELRCVYTRGRR